MKKRVWELDALRGLCILGMIVVHLFYDLRVSGIIDRNALLTFAQDWGGMLFLLLSGICVTLGRHHVRRGLIVFLCGMLCSAVTAGMYFLGMATKGLIIYFGVLHCLGVCMLLWCLFSRFPAWALGLLGAAMIAVAFLFLQKPVVDFPWLIPLGFLAPGFVSSDYFPLLPNLGYFLVGAFLGRTLYRRQETLLPKVNSQWGFIRFLCLCGKHSLWIYLLHQPLLTGILYLVRLF